jgi:phage tail-like protein
MASSEKILPVVFFFAVDIDGAGDETSFSEVSGLDIEKEIEEISEGGVNNYKHRLPGRTKYSNLVLKRGMVLSGSSLFKWCDSVLHGDLEKAVELRDIYVHLLDPSGGAGDVLATWAIINAYPVKWSVSGFNSTESAWVIENLEFSYQNIMVVK